MGLTAWDKAAGLPRRQRGATVPCRAHLAHSAPFQLEAGTSMGRSGLGRVHRATGRPEKASLGAGRLRSVWAELWGPFAGTWGGSPEHFAQRAEAAQRVVLKLGPEPCCWASGGVGCVRGAAALLPGKPLSQAATAVFRPRACAVANLGLDLAGVFLGVPACLPAL